MGALIMTHSDDNGLVLPPKLAPDQVVIVPIYRTEQEYADTVEKGQEIVQLLRQKGIRVKLDARDTHKPGWKFNEYELKGVPIRIALGPKDLENKTIEVARRDTLSKELIPQAEAIDYIATLLDTIQENLFQKAMDMRVSLTHEAEDYEQFKSLLDEKGGFIWAHWDGTPETEEQIKAETKATIRCIPIEGPVAPGKCILTGKDSSRKVLFARAY
jgi:prolyl-tRNA synthetase